MSILRASQLHGSLPMHCPTAGTTHRVEVSNVVKRGQRSFVTPPRRNSVNVKGGERRLASIKLPSTTPKTKRLLIKPTTVAQTRTDNIRGDAVPTCRPPKPIIIFTVGVPASGKTNTLQRLIGVDSDMILDLDKEIRQHPEYDAADPSRVYESAEAYQWADARVEARFEAMLAGSHPLRDPPPLMAVDGTGTRLPRNTRRIQAAQHAGFYVIILWVKVTLDTARRRNRHRIRRVPDPVLRQYMGQVEETVRKLTRIADEVIVYENDADKNYEERTGAEPFLVPMQEEHLSHHGCSDLLRQQGKWEVTNTQIPMALLELLNHRNERTRKCGAEESIYLLVDEEDIDDLCYTDDIYDGIP